MKSQAYRTRFKLFNSCCKDGPCCYLDVIPILSQCASIPCVMATVLVTVCQFSEVTIHRIAALLIPLIFAILAFRITSNALHTVVTLGIVAATMQLIGWWEKAPPPKLTWYYDTEWGAIGERMPMPILLILLGIFWPFVDEMLLDLEKLRAMFTMMGSFLFSAFGSQCTVKSDVAQSLVFKTAGLKFCPYLSIRVVALLIPKVAHRYFPEKANMISRNTAFFARFSIRMLSIAYAIHAITLCSLYGNYSDFYSSMMVSMHHSLYIWAASGMEMNEHINDTIFWGWVVLALLIILGIPVPYDNVQDPVRHSPYLV